MSKFSTVVEGPDGQAEIVTKSKWMYVFSMPHTGILPYPPTSSTDLKRGTFIKWTTNETAVLAELHNSMARLVQQVGIAGMKEIANSARMTERVWKTFGGTGSGVEEVVGMAAKDAVSFPMPPEVLKYLKGFQ